MKNKTIKIVGRSNLPTQLLNFGHHLVYSEGTKTEPFFVDSIKKEIATKYKTKLNDITIINANCGKSYNTLGLAKFAIKDVETRLKNGDRIDHVWIFFDKDSFPKSNYDNAHKKINLLNDSKNAENIPCNSKTRICWHSLPSNECFELLLLLYFYLEESSLSRTLYASKIDEFVQKTNPSFSYAKNLTDIHQTLTLAGGSAKKAIRFGKKLEAKNNIGNPSSLAFKFLEYFSPYFE